MKKNVKKRQKCYFPPRPQSKRNQHQSRSRKRKTQKESSLAAKRNNRLPLPGLQQKTTMRRSRARTRCRGARRATNLRLFLLRRDLQVQIELESSH